RQLSLYTSIRTIGHIQIKPTRRPTPDAYSQSRADDEVDVDAIVGMFDCEDVSADVERPEKAHSGRHSQYIRGFVCFSAAGIQL
ncbi:hypothetical protein, partial [Rhizobium leguminosarum]|uniref:hypothetical protein n=1 Tax=Rhizobium leguminosarum TaxID=384 RepID=UPI00197DBDDD